MSSDATIHDEICSDGKRRWRVIVGPIWAPTVDAGYFETEGEALDFADLISSGRTKKPIRPRRAFLDVRIA